MDVVGVVAETSAHVNAHASMLYVVVSMARSRHAIQSCPCWPTIQHAIIIVAIVIILLRVYTMHIVALFAETY